MASRSAFVSSVESHTHELTPECTHFGCSSAGHSFKFASETGQRILRWTWDVDTYTGLVYERCPVGRDFFCGIQRETPPKPFKNVHSVCTNC